MDDMACTPTWVMRSALASRALAKVSAMPLRISARVMDAAFAASAWMAESLRFTSALASSLFAALSTLSGFHAARCG